MAQDQAPNKEENKKAGNQGQQPSGARTGEQTAPQSGQKESTGGANTQKSDNK